MGHTSNIVTGQFVRISQSPASLGARIGAQLIDWLVEFVWLFAMLWLFIEVLDKMAPAFVNIGLVVLAFMPLIFYSLLWELLAHGQTPGKRILKLRVVKADGSQPSLGALLMRWMLWIADGPTMGFAGVAAILLSRNHQRLGDMAAGTMVIRLESYRRIQVSLDEFDHLSPNYSPVYPQAADLSLEQVNIITQALEADADDPRVTALADKVRQTLGIASMREPSTYAFLQRIVRDYQYFALQE
ncbi:MAG: RDD family protein [Prevotella sp.]|nr:RDD family protein [Prevotella sp.]